LEFNCIGSKTSNRVVSSTYPSSKHRSSRDTSPYQLEKLFSIEYRGQTDNVLRYYVSSGHLPMTTLTLESQASYGHDPHTHTQENSSSKDSQFNRVETDGRTDRRAPPIDLPSRLTRSVIIGNYNCIILSVLELNLLLQINGHRKSYMRWRIIT